MNSVEISHNPFTVDTSFLINGQEPDVGCELWRYKHSRLQTWIEELFDELSNLHNGDSVFQVTFKGVESDYLDVFEAARVANEAGMRVDVIWLETLPTEDRLKQIKTLIDEAKEHPEFAKYLNDYPDIKESLEEAFNRDFDVYVVATMSAGKSTLINAMLGHELLPAANEATTATIARITDNDQMKSRFNAERLDEDRNVLDREENVTQKTLDAWNKAEDTYYIDIEGNIVAIKEREDVRLVLTDTPGPNNSQNQEHERTTMGFIQDSRRNPLILYVLNATQLSTNDDRHLLKLVAEQMSKGGKQNKDRFIFVINKMDAFDPERGEDPAEVLGRVRKYLHDNSIHNPLVYPVSALLTRLIRKPHDEHTRKERGDFRAMSDLFEAEPRMDLLQYMPISSRVKRELKSKGYSELMLRSGLPAVEAMIDEYIDKYNLPHRLKRAYDALVNAIEIGLNEAQVTEQLAQDEQMLRQISHEIENLEERKNKGFDVKSYKDKLANEGITLPKSSMHKLIELGNKGKSQVYNIGERFNGSEDILKANKIAEEAERDLRHSFQELINEYENVFIASQEAIKQDLKSDYTKYISDLFEDSRNLNLPSLEGFERSVSNISFRMGVEEGDTVNRKVKSGSYERSKSKWWNPFSWGRTETVYTYEDKKFVDMDDFWNKRVSIILKEFMILTEAARAHIEHGKETLVDDFIAFMNREFDQRFDELISSFKIKLNDKAEREQAIEQAKIQLMWINSFKDKLQNTLAV